MQTHNGSTEPNSSLSVEVDEFPEIIQVGIISNYLNNNINQLDFDEICDIGREAMDLRKFTNIVIGRLALEVESRYGEDSLGEFAKELGLRRNTVNQYRWVAASFPDIKTYGDLSYTHYRIAAGTSEPKEWIEKAVDNNWNITQFQIKTEGKALSSECDHKRTQKVVIDKCLDCNTIISRTKLK